MADRERPVGAHDDGADRELLEALAVALRPAVADEPSPAELTAFRAVVAEAAIRPHRAPRPARLRRWVAGAVVGGVVLSGGTAYATNPVAPRPVRSAAFALKLPVESPELTDAKDALADLEEELREGRPDQVAAEVEDVREELADLSPSTRAALDARAASVLAAAEAFLADTDAEEEVDPDDADDVDDDSSGPGPGGDDSSGSGSGDDDSSGSGSGGSSSGEDDDEDRSGSGDDGEDRSGSNSGPG